MNEVMLRMDISRFLWCGKSQQVRLFASLSGLTGISRQNTGAYSQILTAGFWGCEKVMLKNVTEILQPTVEDIATIVKVELEIVSSDLVRVAGTGKAYKTIGQRLAYEGVTREVQSRCQAIMVSEPGKHGYCRTCSLKNNCPYMANIICPIVYGGLCHGSIGLIAYDEKQERTLLSNGKELMNFLSRMADMISGKISERVLSERIDATNSELLAVVNSIGHGVIAVDKKGVVLHFNKMAQDLLQLSSKDLVGKSIETVTEDSAFMEAIKIGREFEKKEIIFRRREENVRLPVKMQPILANQQVVGVVALIKDIKKARDFKNYVKGHEDNEAQQIKILGNSDSIKTLKQQVQRVAKSDSTVLIRGESGTGKELFARAIHTESERNKGPFVAINCAAIPETLLESELFGYEEGSFTGAKKGGKPGKFELSRQGTLFLDEIGDMPLHLQAKLLRVLEYKSFDRIGGVSPVKLEARLIAATNQDLEAMVKKGKFREDLYYRINVIPFYVTPLRSRVDDIELLLAYFTEHYNKKLGKSVKGFSREAESILLSYSWPGNVRELKNTVEYCVHMTDTCYIEAHHLPQRVRQEKPPEKKKLARIIPLESVERELINEALKVYGYSLKGKKNAAAALGIGLTTLYRKGKKYHLRQFSD